MKVRSWNPITHHSATGSEFGRISEDKAKILIECQDDSMIDVTLVDPGNSVSVRDKNNQVEYIG